MPAAAVIPAPKVYIKFVAVIKLVVGYLLCNRFKSWPTSVGCAPRPRYISILFLIAFSSVMGNVVTLKKRRCLRKIRL